MSSKTLKVRLDASQDYNAVIRYIAGRPGCVESVVKQFVYVDPAPSESVIDRAPRLESFVQSALLATGEHSRRAQFYSQKYYDENEASINGTGCCSKWTIAMIAWAVFFWAVGFITMMKNTGRYGNPVPGTVLMFVGVIPIVGWFAYASMDPRKKGGEEYRWELAENA